MRRRQPVPFDGCLACQAEPSCTAGTCMAVCGDGKRYNSEDCDDGNIRDGDGCSHDCKVEMGYKCTDIVPAAADMLTLPVIYRDFMGAIKNDEQSTRNAAASVTARTAAGVMLHPDFNTFNGNGTRGAVEQKLGTDGLPVYVVNNNPASGNFTGKTNFDMWYRDTPVYNRTVIGAITADPQRHPLRIRQQQQQRLLPPRQQGVRADAGRPCDLLQSQLQFHHPDRLLVRVPGWREVRLLGRRRRVGLRQRHSSHRPRRPAPRLASSFTLDATTGVAHVAGDLFTGDVDAKLKIGSVYQVSMFHAERQECQSNFKLTLKDFNKPKSQCGPVCGDGIVTHTEVCDDGPGGNIGAYGGCMPGCKKRAPYCGDGKVDADHEKCDDGVNLSEYGGCGPGCVAGPSCGDGVVQSKFEQCDDAEIDGKYGGCAGQCILAPHCGDGIVQRGQRRAMRSCCRGERLQRGMQNVDGELALGQLRPTAIECRFSLHFRAQTPRIVRWKTKEIFHARFSFRPEHGSMA